MKIRYPDKPIHVYSLKMVKEGDWIAQTKLDGHRALIFRENAKIVVLSRHMKTLTVSPQMLKALDFLRIEDGTVLDAEWTSRREAYRQEEMWLFDILYSQGEWLGNISAEERYKKVDDIQHQSVSEISAKWLGIWPVYLVPSQDRNYATLYKSLTSDSKAEGIVLKKKGSRLIGDLNKSADNPNMLKLKFRGGCDGMSPCVVSDEDLKTRED